MGLPLRANQLRVRSRERRDRRLHRWSAAVWIRLPHGCAHQSVALRLFAGEPRLYVALGDVRSVLCAASLELRRGRQAAITFVYKF